MATPGHKTVAVRAVIHFSMEVKAETVEEARNEFHKIDGDELIKRMGRGALAPDGGISVGDWEFTVVDAF